MTDLLMVALIVAAFAGAGAYIWVCDEIGSLPGLMR